jgi:hypothetical protein
VKTALRDAVAWRMGGGHAPSPDAFVAAAVAAARLALDTVDANSEERSRTLAAVQHVARRFTATALFRRIMVLPAARFVRLTPSRGDAEAVVRDRRRRLHAIVLTLEHDAFDAGRIATQVALATPLSAGDRLSPLTIHVYSLLSARRRSFERDVVQRTPSRGRAARVA